MPDPRFCPQCGHAVETQPQDGRPRPVCPQCGWVHYAQHKVCAAAIVQRDGQVLLVQRARPPYVGAWGLPAGYVEVDETPAQAAAREVLEETGLAVGVGPLLGVYPFWDDPRGAGVLFVYLARPTTDHRPPTAPDPEPSAVGGLRSGEEGPVRWWPLDALPPDLVGAGQGEALLDWQRRSAATGNDVRFCPRCGAPVAMRDLFGRPRPQCPACGLVQFREPKTATGVLISEGGRILLARRAMNPGRGLWYVPSGYVDWDERVDVAATREMKEETGLDVAITGLFGVFPFGDAVSGCGTFILYRGHVVGGELRPDDDVTDVGFFAPDELPDLAFETSRLAVDQWLQEQRG